jgi:hypothetical protein
MKTKKVNLFYIEKEADVFIVYHRQSIGEDKVCAKFYFGKSCTVSMTRALKAAKVFRNTMNTYYPVKFRI